MRIGGAAAAAVFQDPNMATITPGGGTLGTKPEVPNPRLEALAAKPRGEHPQSRTIGEPRARQTWPPR